MKKPAWVASPAEEAALVFALPGLLPADQRLWLDLATRTVCVLPGAGANRPPGCGAHLTPSAARVCVALLSAYPHPCSYAALFQALGAPAPPSGRQELSLIVAPVRSALKALVPALRPLGLRVAALRGHGYVLVGGRLPTPTVGHRRP